MQKLQSKVKKYAEISQKNLSKNAKITQIRKICAKNNKHLHVCPALVMRLMTKHLD